MTFSLDDIETLINERKSASPDSSYVAQLNQKGIDKILEKVGEESVEMILAAKNFAASPIHENQSELIGEVADLWFHTMVMLSHLNLNHCDMIEELERRFGRSGLDEKASRPQN